HNKKSSSQSFVIVIKSPGPKLKVFGGGSTMCVLNEETFLPHCWGRNGSGEIGDNTTTLRRIPTKPLFNYEFTHLTVGSTNICGLLIDGTVRCTGYGYMALIGDGTLTDRRTFTSTKDASTRAPLSGVAQIAVSSRHSCAL